MYVTSGAIAQHDNFIVERNVVTHNATLPNGDIWYPGPDCDVIAFQNLSNSTIRYNDLSGNTPTNGGESGGVYVFITSGTTFITVTGAADNGSGEVRLTISCADGPNGVYEGAKHSYANVGGVPAAAGCWTIHNISGSGTPWVGTVDLQGSLFAGLYTSGGTGIIHPTDSPTQNITIAKNFIHDLVDAGNAAYGIKVDSGGTVYASDHSFDVCQNIIKNVAGTGLSLTGQQDVTLKSRVYNNTVYGCINFIKGGSIKNYIVKNNVGFNISGYYWYNGFGTNWGAYNEVDYNCYGLATGDAFWWAPSGGGNQPQTFAEYKVSSGWDAYSNVRNPYFENASGLFNVATDFKPTLNTPMGVSISGLTTDYEGKKIQEPVMGAYTRTRDTGFDASP